MSVRLSLLALSTLLLSACDGNPLQTAASKTDCCCNHCPAGAAPTATPTRTARAGGATGAVAGGGEARTYRARTGAVITGGGRYVRYASSEETLVGGYGGRYGARGGVSVSVTESESSSSRYSYSESSSDYAYGSSSGGYAYSGGSASGGAYGYGPGGVRVSSDPPHHPGYRAAQTDREGYLTWPGKVED